MNKRLTLLCFVLILLLPGEAPAAGSGLYVAPKFVYANAQFDKTKADADIQGAFPISSSAFKHDDAFGGALAVGYDFARRFNLPLRAEIEYAALSRVKGSASSSGIDHSYGSIFTDYYGVKQELDIQTLFLNAYYDFKTGTSFTPWLGAGLGAAFVHGNSYAFYDFDYGSHRSLFDGGSARNSTNFAWNAGAGVGWRATERLTVDLGYRFVYLGEVKNPTWSDMIGDTPVYVKSKTERLYMHQALLALRFEF